jgi:hypothetical protein
MTFDQRMRLAGLLLAMGFACASCTFPSVEYDTSCAAPTSCEKDVATCGNKAQAAQNMCSMKCTMSCVDCDEAYDLALASCIAQCETCSAGEGCTNATESCKALLGVP